MKILNRDQIREADAYTIENEPITSINLMERASTKFAGHLIKNFNSGTMVHIFCGTGNNGGDGLAVSRFLLEKSWKVKTYIVHYSSNFSEDFKINAERLKKTKGSEIINVVDDGFSFSSAKDDLVIDALWGTGLTRAIEGFAKTIIELINKSGSKIIALDIPSGLFCDEKNEDNAAICADQTFTFQFPKYSFMIPENEKFVGKFDVIDIGLDRNFISQIDTSNFFTLKEDILPLLSSRKIFAHKGNFGHAMLISGSYGKIGASILGSQACLRCGVGLLSVYIPGCGYDAMQSVVSEAMVYVDKDDSIITDIPDLSSYSAVGIGPGIGLNPVTAKALRKLFYICKKPLVIDADAINLISTNESIREMIPENSILTPHIGEFERLVGKCSDHYKRLKKLKQFSIKYKCVVVLKGAHTAISTPEGHVYFNSTGNPGMATAGSGDVLTGMITSFLAQGFSPENAAKSAVFIHGLAGDYAARKFSQPAMLSGDIIKMLPAVFKKMEKS